MPEWRTCTWGDLASLAYGKSLVGYKDADASDVRVFGTNGPIGFTTTPLAKGPGVIIGRKGAYRGIHFSSGDYFVIDTAFYLQPKVEFDMRWAYYELLTHDINGMDSGSAIPSTSRDAFYGMPLLVPPLSEQRAIAEVLGALDDKIKSNRRIIEGVMDLATALFNQWRQTVSEWTTTTFGGFAAVYGGATPKTEIPAYWGGPYCWLTPTDVTHLDSIYLWSSARTITDEGLASASTELHPPGTILMTSRATIGAFAVNQIPCAPNQGFIAVRPNSENQRWFLFHEMSRRVPEMIDRANGTTFQEISRGSFKSMELLVPLDPSSYQSLDALVSPLHARAAHAANESGLLAGTRDALLPHLLSGRIRTRGATALVGAS